MSKLHEALRGLQPETALSLFSELLHIPRPSGKEDKVVSWLAAWAMANKYGVSIDANKNVVIKVPGTKGYEKATPVCLQFHTDMVYEPAGLVEVPIDIEVEGDWIWTKGRSRTLGMDNGAGMVLAMDAALTGEHGPLELLGTADEEEGITGATNFRKADHGMKSRLLVNIDTPQRNKIAIASGGFLYLHGTMPITREACAGVCYKVVVDGLAGGHSGDNICDNRGNAVKLMGELLSLLPEGSRVAILNGGGANNAIPYQATVLVKVPGDDAWQARLTERVGEVKSTLGRAELTLVIEKLDTDLPCLTLANHANLVNLLVNVPSGVAQMSSTPGVAAVSTTIANVKMTADGLTFTQIVRGTTDGEMRDLYTDVEEIYTGCGVTVRKGHRAPGWKQETGSPLVASAVGAFEALGEAVELRAYHCCLELALLTDEADPQFDAAVSFGAEVPDEHCKTERVSISSLVLARNVLLRILLDVAQGRVN